ncbi:MAG TPA: hypothetical protein VFI11_07595 [Anaerolineales bacterium]|nr:hypothetical protein [Anaerolineales bacterium]
MSRKHLAILALLLGGAAVLAACAAQPGPEGPPGPQGPAGPAGPPGEVSAADLSCTECHNDTTLIVSKEAQFRENSVHGTGEAFERGASTACAGCHGTEGAKARINAGLPPHDESVVGVTNVSPFDCRTCHNIHTTYTIADFSLTGGGQPVVLERTGGTFDGGMGNLCANCHQFRNELPVAADGNVDLGTDTRFGTHYGAESQMLLGEGGLGVEGSPSPHYSAVEDTCVACHMGEERNHTYEPAVARCQACHADAENFDINGVQTEIRALLAEVEPLLIASGIMRADYTDDSGNLQHGRSVPGVYPEAVAQAMWNYKFVVYDQSMGVHNSAYAKALLEFALEALK